MTFKSTGFLQSTQNKAQTEPQITTHVVIGGSLKNDALTH